MRDPLVIPFAALGLGIILEKCAEFTAAEALLIAAAFLALFILARRMGLRRAAAASSFLALAGTGLLLAIVRAPGRAPEIDASPDEILILRGCVVEPPEFHEDRTQFILELERGARARVTMPADEGESPPGLGYGQKVELDARLRRPRNFLNPGAFDYAAYLARRDIHWNASVPRGAEIKALPGFCGSRFDAAVYGVREAALARLAALYGHNEHDVAMMEALLIGKSGRLEKMWTESFRRTGTYHVLVVSGLHIAFLAAIVLFFLRVCAFSEFWSLVLAALVTWFYALLTGMTTPVVRAAGGFTLFLIARFMFRRARVLNLLAAVGIVLLAADPPQIFEASFQLSFLSVAAIGALAMPLIESTSQPYARSLRGLADADRDLHMEPRQAQFRVELRLLAETASLWTRIPEQWFLALLGMALRAAFYVYDVVAVSAAVQVAMTLPMAVYFHRVSLTGITANVVIVTIFSIATPLGFLMLLTGWRWLASLVKVLVALAEKAAAWHAAWEPQWRIPDPPLWLALAFAGSLALTAIAVRAGPFWRRPALASLAACCVVLVWHPFPAETDSGWMELTAIDVGQAESLLIVSPQGKIMVLDFGGIPPYRGRAKPRLDIGEDVISPYLWSRSIRRVDAVALSHPHEDHMGGLAAVLANFQPRELWVAASHADYVRPLAAAQGVPVVGFQAGRKFEWGGLNISVLAPLAGEAASSAPGNEDSMVLRICCREQCALLTGDIGQGTEFALADESLLDKSAILKVAHHGSNSSTTALFLDRVQPVIAVISAGKDNVHRFPHAAVVRRLEERHTTVLRTDRDGLVRVLTDGYRIRVERTAGAAGRGGLQPAF